MRAGSRTDVRKWRGSRQGITLLGDSAHLMPPYGRFVCSRAPEREFATVKAEPTIDQARFDYALSRVNIVAPSETIARHASKLLAHAGPHGHKYALDAIVAATALTSPPPVTVLTSDVKDRLVLCGSTAHVIKI